MLVDFEKMYYDCRNMLEHSDRLYREYKNMNHYLQNAIRDITDLLDSKTIELQKQIQINKEKSND